MTPAFTFFFGLGLLVLFGWYFITDIASRKRWLGIVLSVLLVAFCLEACLPPDKKIALGLDLKGGTSYLIKLTPQAGQEITKDLQEQAVEVIRKRVDSFGVGEPVITPQGTDRILVQLPGLDPAQIESTRQSLQKVAKLEFASALAGGEEYIAQIEAGQVARNPNFVIKEYKDIVEGKEIVHKILVNKRAELSGEHVTRAFAYYDQRGWGVSLSFDSAGAKIFGDLTNAAYQSRSPLAILLDGEVISAPGVNDGPIYQGQAQISGHFTEKEARDLASALENPLRVPVSIEETRSVSSTLGTDSIMSGVLAGVSGLILVFIFVMIYYRMAGIIAFLGLMVNIVLLFGAMGMFHFVLTLPGIAGIILTIGMAVDANVLIYERLREEMAAGKSISAALDAAYNKAFSAIFDANVTTLITSIILFWQASGSVKGFAITLTLGIIASMFSSLLFTRTAFRWMVERGGLKKLTMLDLIPKRKFDFLGKRRMAAIISVILLGGSLAIFAVRGEKNFGIDFRGGDLLVIDSTQTVDVDEARKALEGANLGDVVIQLEHQGGADDRLSFRSPQGTAEAIITTLKEKLPDRGIIVLSQENVGPQIGMEFAKKAGLALLLGMIGILIYVTIRFEFSFAVGALVALLHDVIITIGIFSLIGGEFSLVMVGAILTIAGYSINDTIVVFDRIREGLKNRERGSVQALMNISINETLGRTILTGGTTLLSVGALYFFGGAVLKDFSFAILVGILVGTYSSIFVAAPVVLWWSRLRGRSIRREVLDAEAATPKV